MSKPRGLTNTQAKKLAKLQRRAGVRYTGAGMTRDQAALAIDSLIIAPPSPKPRPSVARGARQSRHKPTHKQAATLLKLGHRADGLSREQAGYVIAALIDLALHEAQETVM